MITIFRNTDGVQLNLEKLTEKLMASYAGVGGINHVDGKNLPSKRVIAVITVDLLRLLFPGFFDENVLHSSQLQSETSVLLREVAEPEILTVEMGEYPRLRGAAALISSPAFAAPVIS